MNSKYTFITQRAGCHLLIESLLKTVSKHLHPDEIITRENSYTSKKRMEVGKCLHTQIMAAKHDFILISCHDILFFTDELVEEMFSHMNDPDVLACGVFDYSYNYRGHNRFLVGSCNLISKQAYFKNGVFFHDAEFVVETFSHALEIGQKLIKIGKSDNSYSLDSRIYHLNQGFQLLYADLITSGWWKQRFNMWKQITGSTISFDECVHDDGMDLIDNEYESSNICSLLQNNKYAFSMLLLDHNTVKRLIDCMDDIGSCDDLSKELIKHIKKANLIGHPDLYRGSLEQLFDQIITEDYAALFNKIDLKLVFASPDVGRYCSQSQDYLFFIDEFFYNFYSMVREKKIIYAGPHDYLSELNSRKELNLKQYSFFPFIDNYESMIKFLENFDCKDWDIVLISGGFYGNILIGRIKDLGGCALNIGDAICFKLNEQVQTAFIVNDSRTSYKIQDMYKFYGQREYEKYLMADQK